MSDVVLDAADAWREVSPRADAPGLLVEAEGRLRHLAGDLSLRHDFGPVGPVDCPIAYDPVRGLAFRYICSPGFGRKDYSQLRAFSVSRQESYPLVELPLNQWVLWLLEWIEAPQEGAGQLYGLWAADRPAEDRVVIEHRLFALKPGEAQLRLRPLCRDAYRPLAISRLRRELVFSGAEGIYLLSLKGERKLALPAGAAASGEGAAFDPSGAPRILLGGDGLHLWDLESNHCHRLTRNGRHPVWSADGQGVWYRESSSDLFYYDFARDESHCVLRWGNQRHPEFWHARSVRPSRCGRYLALSLTQKQLRGVSRKASVTGSPEKVYLHDHLVCVLDLETREFWHRPGWGSQFCWL